MEAEGSLIPRKSVVVEPTSGNAGTCYPSTFLERPLNDSGRYWVGNIMMPGRMSLVCHLKPRDLLAKLQEKEGVLCALGADAARTSSEAAWDSPER